MKRLLYEDDLPRVLMHLAHSVFLTNRPFAAITLTFWRLGLNVRLVARWEKERLWPKVVVLPQLLHLAI